MAISCDPNDLAAAMACYQCMDPGRKLDALIVLLQDLAETTYTVDELLELGKDNAALSEGNKWEVVTALLCQVANAGSTPASDCENIEGAGDPT